MKILPVGMGIFAAGTGAGGVDGAVIVSTQKGAGRAVEHVIAVGVQVEEFRHKIGWPLAAVLGEPVNIDVAKDGAGRFTAIGALQTVHLGEGGGVQVGHGGIQVAGWPPAQPGKKPLVVFFVFPGEGFDIGQQIGQFFLFHGGFVFTRDRYSDEIKENWHICFNFAPNPINS